MRKLLLFVLLATVAITSCSKDPNLLVAEDPHVVLSKSSAINISVPDTIFKAYLVENFDTNSDGEISKTEALEVTSINVRFKKITSLLGIEWFTNIDSLNCGHTYITSLNLFHNNKLKYINTAFNQNLLGINVSTCKFLRKLDCELNSLCSLNVLNNIDLEYLDCYKSNLTTLDLSRNIVLNTLYTYDNMNLKTIFLSEGQVIKNSYIPTTTTVEYLSNGSGINILDNTFKAYLVANFDKNSDGSISQTEANAITEIHCYSQGIRSLVGIEYLTNLKKIYCSHSFLTSVDLSKNPNLTYVDCGYNYYLTSINLYNCSRLDTLYIDETKIDDLTSIYDCYRSLETLACNNTSLKELWLYYHTSLKSLNCWRTNLTILNLPTGPSLKSLNCFNNQLTALDISKNTGLTTLDCRENQLTALNISKNIGLTTLNCSENQLTTLNVSTNYELDYLNCGLMPNLKTIYMNKYQTISELIKPSQTVIKKI